MSMQLIYQDGAPIIRGMSAADDYIVSIGVEDSIITAGATVRSTVSDTVVDTVSTAVTGHHATFRTTTGTGEVPQWTSLTPGIVTISPDGTQVTTLAVGKARVQCSGRYGSRVYEFDAWINPAQSVTQFVSFTPGSLARHIWDSTLQLVAGKTPSDATLQLYSTRSGNYSSGTVVRNPNNFAAGVDLTGMSVWRSEAGNNGYWPCCAISPRHTVAARHVCTPSPYWYVFLASDGTQVTRKVLGTQTIGSTDIIIEYLDAPLPATVKKYKLLPNNFRNYLPESTTYYMPALSKRMVQGLDANPVMSTPTYEALRLLSTRFATVNSYHFAQVPMVHEVDHSVPWGAWQVAVHSGDSSGPSWMLINSEPVLLGHLATVSGSPHLAEYSTDIEAAMNSLAAAQGDATVYSLQRVDLSGFVEY